MAVALAIAVVAGAVLLTGRGGSNGSQPAGADRAGGSARSELPVQYADAKAAGADLSVYGAGCDRETGRVAMPSVYAPPCVPEWKTGSDNFGATSKGVTRDTIKVVEYIPSQSGDLTALMSGKLDERPAVEATDKAYMAMFEDLFETYGRKVELVPYQAKGSWNDEVAAKADAVEVAEGIGAFASIGGPTLALSYANELAARGVLCIGCGMATPDLMVQKVAPFMWSWTSTADQYIRIVTQYIVHHLVGKPAEYAGDDTWRQKPRKIGVIYFDMDTPVFKEFVENSKDPASSMGFEPSSVETYTLDMNNLGKLAERAQTIVAKMKDLEITTVMFFGDPIMPRYLTEQATAQNYHPEWIVSGTPFTDTAMFGRMYEQKQWAHAFGVSQLPARGSQSDSDSWRLHQWYFDHPPVAQNTAALIFQNFQLLYIGIHLAGPRLTPETFRDGMFSYPPSGGGPTAPRVSFGKRGIDVTMDGVEHPDYFGFDDVTFVWWDADVEGNDEQEKAGKGMYRYMEGGKRYLEGASPPDGTRPFAPDGTVLLYDRVPAVDVPPQYPSPHKALP